MNRLNTATQAQIISCLVEGKQYPFDGPDDRRRKKHHRKTSLRSWPRLLRLSGQDFRESEMQARP